MSETCVRISVCTTCANRAYQLEETFLENLDLVLGNADVEWVIVNYGSTDNLDVFMTEKLSSLPARIVYVSTPPGIPWHLSAAKNIAHKYASGEMQLSLDCDNFIHDAIPVMREYHAAGVRALHLWSGVHRDGTAGRIAVERRLFWHVGGYDEALYPMGYQDGDLLARLSKMGVPIIRAPCAAGVAITNTKDEGIRNCRQDSLTWEDYDRANREISRKNIATGRLIANERGRVGDAMPCIVTRGMLY